MTFRGGRAARAHGHDAHAASALCDPKGFMESRSAFPRTVAAGPEDKIYRRRWLILGVLITSLMAIVLDNTVLNVALKTIAEPGAGLGASQSQLEWGINSYTLVFAGLLFTFGVIGDRVGRKRMLMIGLVAFGFFSLVTAYAQTPDQLIWARAAMGLGAAAVMPQTLSIISNVFDPAERPRAIGIWAMAVGIGVAIGPVVGGLLLAHFWWGSVFLLNVPFTAAGAAAVWLIVPESKNPDPGRIDYVGVLASIAGLVLLVYGIIQGGEKGSWVHADVLGPILAGLAVLAFFAWYERRLRYPSLDVRLFRNPRLSSAVGALALVFFGMMGALFFLSFYLQSVRGYSPLHAGLLSLPFAAGQLLMAPRGAALVRRFGTKAVVASGLMVVTVALAGYQMLGTATPIWVLAALFFVQGAGMGSVMPPATEAVMSVVPRERAGSARRSPTSPGRWRGRSGWRSSARSSPRPTGASSARIWPGCRPRPGEPRRGRSRARRPWWPSWGRAALPGGTWPIRRSRLRARHAHHHAHLGGDHPARRAGRGDLDARARHRPRCHAAAASGRRRRWNRSRQLSRSRQPRGCRPARSPGRCGRPSQRGDLSRCGHPGRRGRTGTRGSRRRYGGGPTSRATRAQPCPGGRLSR